MKATLRPLRDIVANPSGWDSLSNYAGDIPGDEWLCVLTRTRDSEILTDSNFERILADLGGEGENVEVHRFGHWACGWWEALAVRAGTPEAGKAGDILDDLDGYPVYDEEDYSERCDSEANRIWKEYYDPQERVDFIRGHRDECECAFYSWSNLRAVVRGDYYPGIASTIGAT